MAVKVNILDISKMYVGGTEVPSAYVGNVQVYGRGGKSGVDLEWLSFSLGDENLTLVLPEKLGQHTSFEWKGSFSIASGGLVFGCSGEQGESLPDNADFRIFFTSNNLYFDCGNQRYYKNQTSADPRYSLGKEVIFKLETISPTQGRLSWSYDDGQTWGVFSTLTSDTIPLGSNFCINIEKCGFKLYYMKIYDNGELIADYYPQLVDGAPAFENRVDGSKLSLDIYNPYQFKFAGVQIQYTTTDGNVIVPSGLNPSANMMIDGVGYMVFDSIESLPTAAFNGCETLKTMTLPDSITSLGQRCFMGCANLETVNIPSGISEIPNYCFRGCEKLTISEIPSNITLVGRQTFKGCQAITSLVINENTRLSQESFADCVNLVSLIMCATDDTVVQTYYTNTPFANVGDNGTILYFDNELGYQYVLERNGLDNKGWVNSKTDNYIEYTTTDGNILTNGVFQKSLLNQNEDGVYRAYYRNDEVITSLPTFGKTLKTIDFSHWKINTNNITSFKETFNECNMLERISGLNMFDTSNVNTMESMFRKCSALRALDIPADFVKDKVTSTSYMFYRCNSLTSVDLSQSTFTNCSNLSYMFYQSKISEIKMGGKPKEGGGALSKLSIFTSSSATGTLYYNCESGGYTDAMLSTLPSGWTRECLSA